MAKGFYPFKRTSPSTQPNSSETNNSSRDHNMNSASRTGFRLPLSNNLAIPIYTASQSHHDVEMEGRVLLQQFIHQQFEEQHLSDEVLHDPLSIGAEGDVGPEMMYRATSSAMASTPEGYKNEIWIQIGANICDLAEQFAASNERKLIRDQADQVDLGHINQIGFFGLLNEIFKNGINRQHIVALFFFCSDVLIRCVKQQLREQGIKLFLWSMEFLVERVCRWVYDHGGWGQVFSNIYKFIYGGVVIAACVVVAACGVVWIRKNW